MARMPRPGTAIGVEGRTIWTRPSFFKREALSAAHPVCWKLKPINRRLASRSKLRKGYFIFIFHSLSVSGKNVLLYGSLDAHGRRKRKERRAVRRRHDVRHDICGADSDEIRARGAPLVRT